MSRLIATRVSDEHYSKIMGKCAGLGCSVYDYLKMLVETDLNDMKDAKRVEAVDTREAREAEEEKRQARRELAERIRRIARGEEEIDK